MNQFTRKRARRHVGLIRYVVGPKDTGGPTLRLEPLLFLVRPIVGAPEWLDPFLPSVHPDAVSSLYRTRSCIAPCAVARKGGGNVLSGMSFIGTRKIASQVSWLNDNPDWPYAMLYSIHGNYILPSGRFFTHPLGDQAREVWTDEHTGIVAGWKIMKGL